MKTGLITAVITLAATWQTANAQPQPQPQPEKKDCCQEYRLENCPQVKPCRNNDACVIVKLPPISRQDAAFTYNGTHSFLQIFSNAAARGVENATIRAMNATKVCPTCESSHDPQQHCADKEEEADAAAE